jgi:hypothetical protein
MPERPPELRREELLAKNPVELPASDAERVLARTEAGVLDVGRAQEKFVGMRGDQAAEFPAIGGRHALDSRAMLLVEREDTSLEDIDRVQRALGPANLGKREAAICVHDRFDIQVSQSAYFPESLDRADKERFLDQRMCWGGDVVPDIGLIFPTLT